MDENYQNLVNAIILRAAKDYRVSRTYLKNHPKTDELVAIAEKQKQRRKKRKEKCEALGLPKTEERIAPEEQVLTRIVYYERLLDDTERFFGSAWFSQLSDLDGCAILKRLEAEFA